jgi:hypothetical protein
MTVVTCQILMTLISFDTDIIKQLFFSIHNNMKLQKMYIYHTKDIGGLHVENSCF